MDLIFFDLDGTLLNGQSELSGYTRDTLGLLKDKNIAYTVATGRTMVSAHHIIGDHDFALPQIYNNGATIWQPDENELILHNALDANDIAIIVDVARQHRITPFVNTIKNHEHFIFHAPTIHEVESNLVNKYFAKTKASILPIEAFDAQYEVTNISMIGLKAPIVSIWKALNAVDSLVAYSGTAHEGEEYNWIDVHHRLANKGSAVSLLKQQLNANNVICFGDGDNDLTMFDIADERYAPENALAEIKDKATGVIGHHHQDGVAHFLRERFSL
ncbi:HAD family phosphatase [Glaciecola sp. MH2013]|uniref:HAD family hydrolase n=1 Tax=Glaciecola sp. MH2013 TaxID=2785524 RepID=UPI00189FD762|nr:HAD family hydrolase [Glaciecola sp. MH2013]MBF7073148.1 HAD family phosphatase [Glaciecola sp. MH2013]